MCYIPYILNQRLIGLVNWLRNGGEQMRDWLKEKRTDRGFTMSQMASKLDITESYYSMIEAGERQKKMDVALAAKLSAVFDMPLKQIVEFENR